jgi:hypothetical protein
MITCPKCQRPIKSLQQWHNCVQVNIDDLFAGKKSELIFVFDKLLAEIADWEGVEVSATQNCIVFVRHKTFLIVKPMQKQLDVKFYSATQQTELPVIKSVQWNSKFENHIRLATLEELTPAVFNYIMQSYKLL